MAKLPFMMGRYKWLVKVLSVGAECKGEDPNEHKMTTSTKQYNTTADPSSRTPDEKNKQRIQKPYYYSKDYKVFNDPIHGHMALHPVLVKIINTPEFQRLRNIKQLGGIYFVYPGASHNRFEHSIGVAHLSGELAKSLKKKQEEQIENLEEMKKLKTEQLKMLTELKNLKPEYLEELKKLKPEDLKELKKFQDLDPEKLEKLKKLKPEDLEVLQRFNPKDVEKMDNLEELKKSLISDQDVLCVQIAGLCHDLGHGPYSHFYDQMFMKAITDNKGKDFDSKWKHEHASIDMFHHILENTDGLTKMMEECGLEIKNGEKDGDDLMFIKDMIKETQEKSQNENNTDEQQSRKEKKPFLYEIVSNEETGIDVDKFDYLARDCQRLGIPNSFNHERFITFAGICCDENGRKHVCSREKELTNLYEIFHTRLSIHRRACQHRIKMAVEMMIKDALLLVDDHPDFKTMSSKGEMLSLSDSKKDMEAYVKLTDQVIENILNSSSKKSWWQIFGKEDARKLKDARKILQRVMTRDLYRCLGEATLKKKSQEEIKRSLSEVVKGIHEGEEVKVEDVTVSYRMENKEPICKTYDLKDSNEKGTGKTDQVEISEDMKEDLRRQLVNETGVSEDDFEVIEVIYDYGKENEDPISKAYFFRKDDPDKGIPLKKLKVSKLLPKCFSEKILRVYWKNPETNPGIIIKAKDCFEEWCKKNGFEMEKTDDDTGTSKK